MFAYNEGHYPKTQTRHYHPMNSEKICCLKHVTELCSFLKQQSRFSECGDTLINFFQKYGLSMFASFSSYGGLGDEPGFQPYGGDYGSKESIFLLCNESASRYTVSGEMYKAHYLLDQAQAISQEVPNPLKASLFANISCYYEKLNDDKTALIYLEKAIQFDSAVEQEAPGQSQSPTRQIGNAINYNNLAVLDLKQMNYQSSFVNSKKAVVLIEPLIFAEINQKQKKDKLLRNDKAFLDRLQVMLVAYFNLGMSQSKVGNITQAKTIFEHGFKMAKKFLGEEHYFAQRFQRRMMKPLGNNQTTQPLRSFKQEIEGGTPHEMRTDFLARQQHQLADMQKKEEQLNQSSKARQQQLQPGSKGQMVRDNSLGAIDSGKSSQGASQPLIGRRDSKKRSEIIQMINESKSIQEVPAPNNPLEPYGSHEPVQEEKQVKSQREEVESQQREEKESEQAKHLRLLEEEMKAKQKQLQKDQEEENKKMKDLMLMLTQNQQDLSKKHEDFIKKQEEFEAKMAQEREDLIKQLIRDYMCREKMRIKEEQDRAARQKEEELARIQQEQKLLEIEKQNLKNKESNNKEMQSSLQDAKMQITNERDAFLKELRQMKEEQEKTKQQMDQQQKELSSQKQQLEQQKKIVLENAASQAIEQKKEAPPPPQPEKKDLLSSIMAAGRLKVLSDPPNVEEQKVALEVAGKGPQYQGGEAKIEQTKKIDLSDENQSMIKSGNFSMTEQKKGSSDDRNTGGAGSGTQILKSADQQLSSVIGSGKENNPLQNISNQSHCSFTNEQLDDIIKEDYELYDASIILQNEDFKNQLEDTKLVSQVIYSQGFYYKIYCEGFLQYDLKNQKQPCFRFFGVCTDQTIQITEEKLDFLEIKSLLKLIQVRDAMPPLLPLRHIRTFEQLCGHYLLPYIIINNGQGTPGTQDENNTQTMENNYNFTSKESKQQQQFESQDINQTVNSQRQIEYWGRPPGFFKEEVHIMFLNNTCNVGLHYIAENYFRISLFSLESEAALNPLYIDLQFDDSSFSKFFELIDASSFSENNQSFPQRPNETYLKSIRIVEKAFIVELVPGLQAFETYLIKEFGANAQFNYLAYERTYLIYQLKIKDEGNLKELWCVRDDAPAQELKVTCHTLYELRIKKRISQKVEKFFSVKYDQFWNHFAIEKKDMDRSQLIMFSAMLLNSLFLHMPTMEMNRGDQEDSDYEEEINISQKRIEPVESCRKIIEMQGEKVILTMYLLGYDQSFLGIKVAIYNSALIKDLGFFLTVDQQYWEAEEHERVRVSKRRQEYLRDNYYLDEFLRKKGFDGIVGKLIMNQQEKSIQWKSPYGKAFVDVFESYFTRQTA